jgi:hypothetical protein
MLLKIIDYVWLLNIHLNQIFINREHFLLWYYVSTKGRLISIIFNVAKHLFLLLNLDYVRFELKYVFIY